MHNHGVLDLKAFVPARDFDLSRRFYSDLGFTEKWYNDQVAEFALQPWGPRVLYISDPSGVLWHIADTPRAAT